MFSAIIAVSVVAALLVVRKVAVARIENNAREARKAAAELARNAGMPVVEKETRRSNAERRSLDLTWGR